MSRKEYPDKEPGFAGRIDEVDPFLGGVQSVDLRKHVVNPRHPPIKNSFALQSKGWSASLEMIPAVLTALFGVLAAQPRPDLLTAGKGASSRSCGKFAA